MRKTHQRGAQIAHKHWYENTTIERKHSKRVTQSAKNNSTPIPGGTSEHGKNAPEGCTNCAEASVVQYLRGKQEDGENAPEGWTNQRQTLVLQYQEARQNMRKTHQRGAQIAEKHGYFNT